MEEKEKKHLKNDELFSILVNISSASESTLDRLSTILSVFVKKFFDNKDFSAPSNPDSTVITTITRIETLIYTVYELEERAKTEDEQLELLYYKDLVLKSLVILTNIDFFVKALKRNHIYKDAYELKKKIEMEFKIEASKLNVNIDNNDLKSKFRQFRAFKALKPIAYKHKSDNKEIEVTERIDKIVLHAQGKEVEPVNDDLIIENSNITSEEENLPNLDTPSNNKVDSSNINEDWDDDDWDLDLDYLDDHNKSEEELETKYNKYTWDKENKTIKVSDETVDSSDIDLPSDRMDNLKTGNFSPLSDLENSVKNKSTSFRRTRKKLDNKKTVRTSMGWEIPKEFLDNLC